MERKLKGLRLLFVIQNWLVLALLTTAIVVSSGCGKSAPVENIVSGKVLVKNQPASGLYVLLHQSKTVDAVTIASARTGEDGSFATQVSEPGHYVVTLFWPSMVTVDGSIEEGPDRFNNRLRDPRHPITEIDVREGENLLAPLEVK